MLRRLAQLLLIALAGISCSPSAVPDDFRIIITSGAMHPAWGASRLQIDAGGHGSFRSWSSQLLDAKLVDSLDFALSEEAVAQVWAAVKRNDFFHRRDRRSDGKMQDGGFIHIFVVGRGDSTHVIDEQVPVRPLVRIVETVNQVVPKRARLMTLD